MFRLLFITLTTLLSALPAGAWTVEGVSPARQDTVVAASRPRQKASGYRIQIYSGSNGRKSKQEAYRVGEVCHTFFPELSVYCRYKEPRWYCRVGDFPTMEAAQHYVALMRRTSQFMECHIVKSQVLLPLHSVTPEEND